MMERLPRRQSQHGAALLLAMIIVTLIATLATGMVWQQWRAVQTETAERTRTQSAWILSGALDWSRLILKEDKQDVDHSSDIWGTPLAEARLSTFLAIDKNNNSAAEEEGPDAFLSGRITDLQSRFNLRNLVKENKVSAPDLEAFVRLCENLNVSGSVATLIANGLKDSTARAGTPGVSADPPLPPTRLADLTWLGVDPQVLHRLEPYIVLLDEPTTVNVNTAEREVIAAVVPNLNMGDAERLVQARQRAPIKTNREAATLLGVDASLLERLDVKTSFFEVRGRLRLDDRVLEQRSVVHRVGKIVTVKSTELVNSNDGTP